MGRETLRELGNEHYKAGQFKDAETLYSQAYAWVLSSSDGLLTDLQDPAESN